MFSFSYCAFATLCGIAILSSSGAFASPQPQQLAQQTMPASPQAAPAAAPGELERLQAQLEAANERIKVLDDLLALERAVTDDLMHTRPARPADTTLINKLESVGIEFERVLLELKQVSSH
jgi:hypothetical protein